MTARASLFTAAIVAGIAQVPLFADDVTTGAEAEALRFNPFRRPVLIATPQAAVELDTQPVLRGVMLAGEDSLANIDGELYALGETKGGITLTDIDETGATVRRNGVDQRLALTPNEASARPALANRDES